MIKTIGSCKLYQTNKIFYTEKLVWFSLNILVFEEFAEESTGVFDIS